MHRRKSSREDPDDATVASNGGPRIEIRKIPPTPDVGQRETSDSRASSSSSVGSYTIAFPTSHSIPPHPPSAGPYVTSFSNTRITNGHAKRHSLSMSSHTRTMSGSYRNLPPMSSPLSNSFPRHSGESASLSAASTPKLFAFPSAPEMQRSTSGDSSPTTNGRRHNRIHSRNLSVFFPRPGTLPHSSIAEDGADVEAPMKLISQGPDSPELRAGFTFGQRHSFSDHSAPNLSHSPLASRAARRGHHHKHSLSHNFFSFLEPGSQNVDSSSSSPSAVEPVATPLSSFPADEQPSSTPPLPSLPPSSIPPLAVAASICEFLLGASLWVSGQQTGSLSCTGLGYWVIFDAFGVILSRVVPSYFASDRMQHRTRRSYGNGRLETVLMFAQSVYLIFSSVYVCKETVEHLLLAAGDDMRHHGGHHHHAESMGLPLVLTFITLISLIGSAFAFENHAKLVQITGRQLPQLTSLLPSTRTSFSVPPKKNQAISPLALLLSNPFSVSPIAFAVAIASCALFFPEDQQRQFDLFLAGVEAIVTFGVAYPASVALGSVLLQTSPARGLASGRMESFLRAMKEIERHPQVLHLPPPHIWQLTPSTPSKQTLVVTLELHVRKDMDDQDVLKLTKWAWERCVTAMGFARGAAKVIMPEVTIGIVKG